MICTISEINQFNFLMSPMLTELKKKRMINLKKKLKFTYSI